MSRNFLLLICSLAVLGCNKDVFDLEEYKKLVEVAQPVQNIDASHTWDLTANNILTVEPVGALPGATRLLVLDANPAQGRGATILGDYLTDGRSKAYIGFVSPATLTKFYAALTDADGNYTVTSFTSADHAIDFSHPLASRIKVDTQKIGRQSFSYCFEDELPEPGDYDYNDVVLRISQQRTGQNQITLHVTMSAVGSLTQLAGAIRLVDYAFDDIESVTTVGNETFDEGYKKSSMPYIDSSDLLMRGLNGEAVINLFEDAHWATGAAQYASEGYLLRHKYNVSKTTGGDYEMVAPRTVSFVITFKKTGLIDYFTLNTLDPFVIIGNTGALMENHAVYKYRRSTILHEYTQPAATAILPWAIVVPTGGFRYPLDGTNIGFAKDGALFGAYMTSNHSFGQWAESHTQSLDWYNYPTSNMVY